MRIIHSETKVTPQTATAAANTAVTITLAAVTDEFHVLRTIDASYEDPADNTVKPTGQITVTFGGVSKFDADIVENLFQTSWGEAGLYTGTLNEACVITLAAGGAGVVGKLNITSS